MKLVHRIPDILLRLDEDAGIVVLQGISETNVFDEVAGQTLLNKIVDQARPVFVLFAQVDHKGLHAFRLDGFLFCPHGVQLFGGQLLS